MNVLTIIVNYRTPDLTIKAAESVLLEIASDPSSKLIIVDNNSEDGSFSRICSHFDNRTQIAVHQSPINGGFGAGINFGLSAEDALVGSYSAIYLLNSDALVEPGVLSTLHRFLISGENVGIVGSYVHGLNGEPHTTSFRFPTVIGELAGNLRLGLLEPLVGKWIVNIDVPESPCQVDWVAGASMLVSVEVFRKIGMFDEGFFLYYEETDFCLRAKKSAFQTWYVPTCGVSHIGGGSTGFKDISKPRSRYWFRSRQRYFFKHHGTPYLLATNVVWVLSFVVWKIRGFVLKYDRTDPPRLLGDFVRHSFFPLPKVNGPVPHFVVGS